MRTGRPRNEHADDPMTEPVLVMPNQTTISLGLIGGWPAYGQVRAQAPSPHRGEGDRASDCSLKRRNPLTRPSPQARTDLSPMGRGRASLASRGSEIRSKKHPKILFGALP